MGSVGPKQITEILECVKANATIRIASFLISFFNFKIKSNFCTLFNPIRPTAERVPAKVWPIVASSKSDQRLNFKRISEHSEHSECIRSRSEGQMESDSKRRQFKPSTARSCWGRRCSKRLRRRLEEASVKASVEAQCRTAEQSVAVCGAVFHRALLAPQDHFDF